MNGFIKGYLKQQQIQLLYAIVNVMWIQPTLSFKKNNKKNMLFLLDAWRHLRAALRLKRISIKHRDSTQQGYHQPTIPWLVKALRQSCTVLAASFLQSHLPIPTEYFIVPSCAEHLKQVVSTRFNLSQKKRYTRLIIPCWSQAENFQATSGEKQEMFQYLTRSVFVKLL